MRSALNAMHCQSSSNVCDRVESFIGQPDASSSLTYPIASCGDMPSTLAMSLIADASLSSWNVPIWQKFPSP